MPQNFSPRITNFAARYGRRYMAVLTGLAVGGLGVVLLTSTKAAGPFVAAEPELGSITSPAVQISDATASSSKAVKFAPAGTGGFQANCIVIPSVCGYPDATNTGVPAGVTLTNSGSITVSTNGAVVDGKNIVNGTITVLANNVTIKNTRITTCDYYPIRYFDNDNTGLIIQDTEISGTCTAVTACLSFNNYTAIRVHCHGGADGFKADGSATIQDSYIHSLAVSQDSHNDGVQTTGGDNVTLRHNTFNVGDAGVCVQFGSSNRGWLVTENLFNCGGWMLNGNAGTSNSTFTNNRFTRIPGYGPGGPDGTGNTWSGNYYDDNNAPVN